MRYVSPVNLCFRLPVALCVASLAFTPLWAVEDPAATPPAVPTVDPGAVALETNVGEKPADASAAKTDGGNPYRRLTLRNAFAIKPPPVAEPVLPPVVTNPPVNLPIFVTGFSLLKGVKKVYLVINRPGSKGPDYVTASEGEEFEGFQVVAIDPRKETVRVLNGGNEVTLNFKDNGMKAVAGGAAPMPGGPTGIPNPRGRVVPVAGGDSGPTIIGGGGGGSGVIGGGAAPVAAPVQPAGAAPTEIRGRYGVITGGQGSDPTVPTATAPAQSGYVVPAGGFQDQPVPVPRTRPAPPPPPLPGL